MPPLTSFLVPALILIALAAVAMIAKAVLNRQTPRNGSVTYRLRPSLLSC